MKSETFLAFNRDNDGPARFGERAPTLEAAVSYDIYDEIDRRNGWTDEESPKPKDEAIESGANMLREFILFCVQGFALDDEKQFRTCLRRFVAISHHFFPNVLRGPQVMVQGRYGGRGKLVEGPPLTLKQLAMQPQLRSCEKQLKRMAAEFMKRLQET